jgi:hypothetical protein
MPMASSRRRQRLEVAVGFVYGVLMCPDRPVSRAQQEQWPPCLLRHRGLVGGSA